MTNTAQWTRTWWIALVLTVLGIIVAGYLTWLHLTDSTALCAGVGGCEDVQYSVYANIGKIPVAAIGLLGYVAMLGVLFLEKWWSPLTPSISTLGLLGLALVGTLFSAYLTYIEFFVLETLCPYCIASAIIMVALLIVAICRWVLLFKEETAA